MTSLDSLHNDAIMSLPVSVENMDNFELSLNNNELYECSICLDLYSKKEIKRVCANKHGFCKACAANYFLNLINQSKVLEIKCPYNTCFEVLKQDLIRELLNDNDFQKFENMISAKHFTRNVSQRHCPQNGCQRALIVSQEKSYSDCHCGVQVCNTCNKLWHPGKTCLETIHAEVQLPFQDIEEIKFCVMCKTIVQRVEGCTHITCPVCDYDWCWICGNEYTKNHVQKCLNLWRPKPSLFQGKVGVRATDIAIENSIKWKKVFLYIISLPLRALLLPAIVFGLWKPFKKAERLHQKVCLGASCFLLNIVYNIALLFLLILMMIAQDIDSIYIYLVPFVVLLLPYILHTRKLFCKNKPIESIEQKRWSSMDPNTFQYTSVSRPVNGNLNLKEFMSNNSIPDDLVLQQDSNPIHFVRSQAYKESLQNILRTETHKEEIEQNADVVIGMPL